MASLNAFRFGLIIFTVGCYVLANSQNDSVDNKHQRRSIARFFKSVAKIITKHGIDIGSVGSNITNLLHDDPKAIYKCGQKLIKYIEKLNENNKTALTNQEKDQIEADFCSLISWISMCNTYDLWRGEFGGGSICAAILKSSGSKYGNRTSDYFSQRFWLSLHGIIISILFVTLLQLIRLGYLVPKIMTP